MSHKLASAASRACLLALGLLYGSQGADAGAPPLEGAFKDNFILLDAPAPAPQTWFWDGAGRRVTLADFQGQVVLLNFWATWCAPCIREMPTLDRLQAALGTEGLAVLAVSEDRGGLKTVRPFLAELGIENLDLYLDRAGQLLRDTKVVGLPTTFIIDRQGRLVGGLQGPAEWQSDAAIKLIRYYLRQPGEVIKTDG